MVESEFDVLSHPNIFLGGRDFHGGINERHRKDVGEDLVNIRPAVQKHRTRTKT